MDKFRKLLDYAVLCLVFYRKAFALNKYTLTLTRPTLLILKC